MISRRKDPSAAQSDGGSESANSYGTAHAGGNNADAGAQASDSEHPIDRFPGDNAEKRGSSQKPATSGSDSESDGESAGLEHWPSLPNRLSERDVPATAIKIRFNSRLRGLKRKLAGILQEFDQDRYAEVERRQAEREGSRALKECEKQQQTYPRVQPQAYLALIAPDGSVKVSMSEGLEENPKVRRAAELLTASLKHMVAGQQLDKRIAAVAAALAARAAGRSLGGANRRQPIHLSRLLESSRADITESTLARAPPKRAPSKELVRTARTIFRTHVRPLQDVEGSHIFAPDSASAKLTVCSGSDWKECKEQCRCQQRCAALRAKTGWPADLACVDPNDKGTSVDSQWSHAFLRFAKTHGWYNQAALANQPNRCCSLVYTTVLRKRAACMRVLSWLKRRQTVRLLCCLFQLCNIVQACLKHLELMQAALCRREH